MALVLFVGFAELSGFHIGVWPDARSPLPKDRLFDLTRSTVTAAGLLAGVFAIVYSYRKQKIEEANSHRADSDSLGTRYQEAAEQLGHESAAVRLAGIYALSRLSDSDSSQRLTICRLFCAYLRMPYNPEDAPPGEQEVRYTIIKVIAEHLADPLNQTSWCGFDLDFSGAVFDGGSFQGVHFTKGVVTFAGCRFVGGRTLFSDTTFSGARVSFGDGDGEPAIFDGGDVQFTGATFMRGHISFTFAKFIAGDVSFGGSFFGPDCNVSFGSCTIDGGHLSFGGPIWLGAKLAGGKLRFSLSELKSGTLSFMGVDFCGTRVAISASLSGTRVLFDEAWFQSGKVSFEEAEIGESEISFNGAHNPESVVTPWPVSIPTAGTGGSCTTCSSPE